MVTAEEVQGCHVIHDVAGDVAECGEGSVCLLPRGGVKVRLEGREYGDEQMDVVDSQTHLQIGRERV